MAAEHFLQTAEDYRVMIYIVKNLKIEPCYDEYLAQEKAIAPYLQQVVKIVGTHYDGRLASCNDLIADAPIDLIESLTPPPEGDLVLAEARAAWPSKSPRNIRITGKSLCHSSWKL
jgi:hypothetical protein